VAEGVHKVADMYALGGRRCPPGNVTGSLDHASS
jgi:hypothetical protein